jgi:hypothetical protein
MSERTFAAAGTRIEHVIWCWFFFETTTIFMMMMTQTSEGPLSLFSLFPGILCLPFLRGGWMQDLFVTA